MRILFDTNVILDVLLLRQPYEVEATKLVASVERSEINGVICANSITTIYYLINKAVGREIAINSVNSLTMMFDVVPVNKIVLQNALKSKFLDFEDAVLNESAVNSGVDGIVTRNPKDFKSSTLPIYNPKELITVLGL
ncbi:PIN domain-containing protein [Desulfobacterota bacterium AH_259_B03_O07]|nr:PIN domain-containing protein [Desulfobacterota bacterium AH_259_B03_O07]